MTAILDTVSSISPKGGEFVQSAKDKVNPVLEKVDDGMDKANKIFDASSSALDKFIPQQAEENKGKSWSELNQEYKEARKKYKDYKNTYNKARKLDDATYSKYKKETMDTYNQLKKN